MKRPLNLFLTALSVLFLTGCVNTTLDSDAPKKFDDLIVSSDFSWATSRDVQFLITADNSTVINITSEDGKVQYHKGFYSQLPDAYDVTINLPTYVKNVLVNGRLKAVTESSVAVTLSNASLVSARMRKAKAYPTEGLLAAWRFDENSGSSVSDALGVHNGTFTGAKWTNGISGSALEFDGVDGNMVVPNNSNFNPTGDKISVSFWFKLSEVGASGSFIYQNVKYMVRMDAQGRVSFSVYTPGWKSLVMAYTDRILNTDWHHVAATYDGATMKIYVDGVLKASDANTGSLKSSPSDVMIGKQGSINPYKGIIDEMLVYGTVLTEEQINQIHTSTPNTATGVESLVSYWDLNENSGTVVTDKQGVSNGTISNANWGTGINGRCLEFNGTNSNVNMPSVTKLNPTETITIMAWVKTKDNRSAKIFQKGDWDGYGIGIDKWLGWQGTIRMADNTSVNLVWGGGLPLLNTWYHVAVTYDGATMKIFINGQLKNSKAVTGKLVVNSRNLSIGSENAAQKFFNGSIDEVKLFSAALDQTQIQSHFNNQVVALDQDGDGVPNESDAYPNDPARAFNNYYPAQGYGSLAFEDLWPGKGDYDFNDLVADYRFKIVTNSNNKVTEVISTTVVRAIGAGYENGFGFQLPGANLNSSDIQVEGSRYFENFIKLNANGTEAGQDKITVIVFDNANRVLVPVTGFGVNVVPGTPYVKPDTTVVNIGFTPGKYSISDLDLNNFNPFLIINKERGKEVHLPNYSPTSLANSAYLGTSQDDSKPLEGRYYKTAENLPWAINMASTYDYTIESVMITTAYLKYKNWAESTGVQFPDWYLKNSGYRDESKIYMIP